MGETVRLRILGPVDVYDETRGRKTTPNGTKQRALLSTLVVRQGQTLSMDRLIEELWGDVPPGNATNALQAHIARLRRLLGTAGGAADIVTDPPGYHLRLGPHETDVDEFHRLSALAREITTEDPERAVELFRRALGLWRGAAFEGCVTGSILAGEAALLEEQRLTNVEGLFDAHLRTGRHGEIVGELEEMTAAHPLRERFYDQLMVALYRCGRQSEAIGTYDRARRNLLRELGVEPGPALRGRMQAVLAHSPSLLPGGRDQLTQEIDQLRTRMNSLVQQQEALIRMVSRMSAAAGLSA
uniref:OmpR/PhoB-type domain-containing protein n=2 Tax=environmental samples TaxID=48479 RepID=S5TKV2_9BACT|nr:hypothetical protein [uncultured bacterium esnapd10]AGS49599.1 putative regulatory protein [uncultured bacterium esnapd11]